MEGRVKSHISNKTYITNLEKLEGDDKDILSELYIIPISGHKIMVAPGKTIMDATTGISYCFVYVIKNDKVICKLGVYEKSTNSMPIFFDLSTFPEGSFCLFDEYEKNPSKLIDLEIVDETQKGTAIKGPVFGRNIFDYLIEEFSKIEEKRARLKSAYKSLFETYKELTKTDKEKKNKKMESILRTISEAGKESEPNDTFLKTLKTNADEKPVFVMTILALQFVFLIDFTIVTDNDDYKKMKNDWPISNATKDLEIDVDTYTILDPSFYPVEQEVNENVDVEEEYNPPIESVQEEGEVDEDVDVDENVDVEVEEEYKPPIEPIQEEGEVDENVDEDVDVEVEEPPKKTPFSFKDKLSTYKKSSTLEKPKQTEKEETVPETTSKPKTKPKTKDSIAEVVESLSKDSTSKRTLSKEEEKKTATLTKKLASALTKDMRKDIAASKRSTPKSETKKASEPKTQSKAASEPEIKPTMNKQENFISVANKQENVTQSTENTKIKKSRSIPKIKRSGTNL